MLRLVFLSFTLLMTTAACQSEKVGLTTEEIGKSASVIQWNGNTATCTVTFYVKSKPGIPLQLEDDAAVACNGHMAIFGSGNYSVSFYNTSMAPVLLTIVRPKAGALSSEYLNF